MIGINDLEGDEVEDVQQFRYSFLDLTQVDEHVGDTDFRVQSEDLFDLLKRASGLYEGRLDESLQLIQHLVHLRQLLLRRGRLTVDSIVP